MTRPPSCRLLAYVTAPLLLLSGWTAAAELPERFEESPELKISMNAEYPPLESVDPATGEVVGFDVDLITAIAERLGLTISLQTSSFEQLAPSLQTGRTDLIISGMYDTPKRQEVMDFVDYLRAGAQVYTVKSSDLKTLSDICGKLVSVPRTTSYPDKVKVWSDENCVAAGLPPVELSLDVGRAQQQINIKTGRVVAGVTGLESLGAEVTGDAAEFMLLGEPIAHAIMGIGFRKDDVALRDAVHATFKELLADGAYDALLAKWNLGPSAYREATINLEPGK